MASSVVGGRSKYGSRAVRSAAAVRHHKSKTTAEDGEVKKPDVDEIRRRRAAYFGRPVAERQKIVRTKQVDLAAKKPRVDKDEDVKRKTKAIKATKATSKRPSRSISDSERRTADYVYASGPAPDAPHDEKSRRVSRGHHSEGTAELSQQRRHSKHGSSSRNSLPTVVESDISPHDSISVVAQNRNSRSQRTSTSSRPVLKRSSTTSSKLQAVPEVSGGAEPQISPRRSSKRDSTLLGSIFRRQSTTSIPTPPRLVECLTCGSDDIPHSQSAKLTCGHRMCHECLTRIFEMSVKDPAHMPPRCCTDDHIPLKHVDKLFDIKFKTTWNRKYQEYHTKNRIYCPAPKCGEWIKPSHIHRDTHGRRYAQCPRCKTKVCTTCNNKVHRSAECPQDPEIAKLVEQAKAEGWQRCYSCNAMVELREGCNHMTCRCMAEFCMICGCKWKTCECPWFNYSQLPNPDRLNDMRVPEPIRVIYRRVFDAAAARPAAAAPEEPAPQRREEGRTYREEMEQRRRQERLDADLARRMQLASLMENEDEPPRNRDEHQHMETWGLGNAAGHFMNDDFVNNAANVVMSAFGDAAMGRRGDRASGRRRRARQSEQQNAGERGLVPNFLGDESVLGVGGPMGRSSRAAI